MRKLFLSLIIVLGLSAGFVSAQSTATATVTWANVAGETGYRLEMQTGGTGAFSIVATVAADVVSAQVPGLVLATQYCFQVVSLGAGGLNSAPSPAVCSTPIVPPVSAIISINWTQP